MNLPGSTRLSLKREIFSYFRRDDELVIGPFQRLIREKQLSAYTYDGFFAAMDTFKDKRGLDNLDDSGNPQWRFGETQARSKSRCSLFVAAGLWTARPEFARPEKRTSPMRLV